MMEVPHPTAGWEQVGEKFYRKTQLYTQVFDADLDLDNYIVAGAPYGGAVGIVFLVIPLDDDVFQKGHALTLPSQPYTEMRRNW